METAWSLASAQVTGVGDGVWSGDGASVAEGVAYDHVAEQEYQQMLLRLQEQVEQLQAQLMALGGKQA